MRFHSFAMTAVAAFAILAGPFSADAQEYPTKEIQGVIQWGAGGSTDTVMRSVTPKVQEILGQSVILRNVTGGAGAIALNQVASSAADGYTLLMGAENPLIYKVMGLGTKDYGDFVPINILARGTPILVARPDAPFDDYASMVEYIKANPNEVRFGSTGPGGLPSVVTAMMNDVEGGLPVTVIPYDGDGPALTALQSGAIDVMPAVLGAAVETVRANRLKALAVFTTEEVEQLPGVETVVEANDAYSQFLPWGPFFGVFVAEGTPDDVVSTLRDAFKTAAEEDSFAELMDNRGYTLMNISGEEAQTFMKDWQQTTAWLLQDAELTKTSPEEFGIERPGQN